MKRWTLRGRLTLAYVLLTVVTGAILLGLTMVMADPLAPAGMASAPPIPDSSPDAVVEPAELPSPPPVEEELNDDPIDNPVALSYSSLIKNGFIALGVVALVSAFLGWFTARRALRPVRSITAAARRAAEQDLSTRIELPGPNDEIKELADAFDHMLGRLERSFTGQRRFIANAAHELKTPVAAQRAVTEVTLSRPQVGPETVALGRKLLTSLDRQERVLAGLLTLAQNAETVRRDEIIDLARFTEDILHERVAHSGRGIELTTELDTAKVRGDAALVEQLVRNLVDNAYIHNSAHGWISVRTKDDRTSCSLEIANGGAHIDSADGAALFEPFQRLCFTRADPPPGNGLGLSVVRAIAEAHGGSVTALPRTEGGLAVEVRLPPAEYATKFWGPHPARIDAPVSRKTTTVLSGQ
ncbi:two-component sensor histidine kinase [Amycolatopsis antarctica]|uniref:histidine kinase n=1 Tax=Amycolatopsis antarctica TaxID=1854586 RepID=A0A263CYL0_9PSEU|nr:ATP-binding protein [Amycolatopsis antarctica]OZM71243.1 two-component sensor histidine kinase [Amycolatopsis antarctica]